MGSRKEGAMEAGSAPGAGAPPPRQLGMELAPRLGLSPLTARSFGSSRHPAGPGFCGGGRRSQPLPPPARVARASGSWGFLLETGLSGPSGGPEGGGLGPGPALRQPGINKGLNGQDQAPVTKHLGATKPESAQDMHWDSWGRGRRTGGGAMAPQSSRGSDSQFSGLPRTAVSCGLQPCPAWAKLGADLIPGGPVGPWFWGGGKHPRVPGPEGPWGAGGSRGSLPGPPSLRPSPLPARRRGSSGRGRRRRAARSCRPGRAGARPPRSPSPGTGPGAGGPPGRPGRAGRRRCESAGSRCCRGGRGSEGAWCRAQ